MKGALEKFLDGIPVYTLENYLDNRKKKAVEMYEIGNISEFVPVRVAKKRLAEYIKKGNCSYLDADSGEKVCRCEVKAGMRIVIVPKIIGCTYADYGEKPGRQSNAGSTR